MPVNAMQLDDSVSTDHACFADSTDVFVGIALSWLARRRRQVKAKTAVLRGNS